MTEKTTAIEAKPRDVIGKANRRLRATGEIAAVLYGGGREPLPLAVDRHDFELMMQRHGGGATLVQLSIEGESGKVNTIIKDVQISPIKGTVMHVDFMAIRMDQVIQTTASMHFVGESPGVKEGGVLLHDLREFNIEALPTDLPDSIEVDISNLELNHSLTVSEIVAPAGVVLLDDPDTVICSITLPTAEPVEEEIVEEEEAEPSLIGESEEEEVAE